MNANFRVTRKLCIPKNEPLRSSKPETLGGGLLVKGEVYIVWHLADAQESTGSKERTHRNWCSTSLLILLFQSFETFGGNIYNERYLKTYKSKTAQSINFYNNTTIFPVAYLIIEYTALNFKSQGKSWEIMLFKKPADYNESTVQSYGTSFSGSEDTFVHTFVNSLCSPTWYNWMYEQFVHNQ